MESYALRDLHSHTARNNHNKPLASIWGKREHDATPLPSSHMAIYESFQMRYCINLHLNEATSDSKIGVFHFQIYTLCKKGFKF